MGRLRQCRVADRPKSGNGSGLPPRLIGVMLRLLPETYLSGVCRVVRRAWMRDDDRRALLDQWFRADANPVLAYLLHRTDPQTAGRASGGVRDCFP
jgi:hypothetical protein